MNLALLPFDKIVFLLELACSEVLELQLAGDRPDELKEVLLFVKKLHERMSAEDRINEAHIAVGKVLYNREKKPYPEGNMLYSLMENDAKFKCRYTGIPFPSVENHMAPELEIRYGIQIWPNEDYHFRGLSYSLVSALQQFIHCELHFDDIRNCDEYQKLSLSRVQEIYSHAMLSREFKCPRSTHPQDRSNPPR